MKRLLGCVVLAVSLATSSAAWAGYGIGVISQIYIMPDGVVIFSLSGDHVGNPTCDPGNRWAFNASTPGGQAQLSGLLLAYASAKTVTIWGADACNIYPNSETVAYYQLH